MRYFRAGDFVVAEKVRTGQRYSLKAWQFDLFSRFDGQRSFEEVAKQVHDHRPGAFTAAGLMNFYHWLYTEDLVLCECESIFELVIGAEEDAEEESDSTPGLPVNRWVRPSATSRLLAASAVLVLGLSVLRLVEVTSPVFEPALDWIQARTRNTAPAVPAITLATGERLARESRQTEMTLAGSMDLAVLDSYDTAYDLGVSLLEPVGVSPNLERAGSLGGRP